MFRSCFQQSRFRLHLHSNKKPYQQHIQLFSKPQYIQSQWQVHLLHSQSRLAEIAYGQRHGKGKENYFLYSSSALFSSLASVSSELKNTNNHQRYYNKNWISSFVWATLLMLSPLGSIALAENEKEERKEKKWDMYTYEEIEKHTTAKTGIWVTYEKNVYDITEFIASHPGGPDKIILAAGKSIEPYWNVYKQHLNQPYIVPEILSPMKIGEISNYDPEKYANTIDPYVNDPIRIPDLKYHSSTPCNAEVPSSLMMENWITPNDLWFVRNHHPVPDISAKDYACLVKTRFSSSMAHDSIMVGKDVEELKKNKKKDFKELSLNLEDIKTKYKKQDVISTIECGGNRRSELNDAGFGKTSGTAWSYGAISNAKWSGARLRDVLLEAGVTDEDVYNGTVKHIQFEGWEGVLASIPAEKAMSVYGDVLLAYEMNGEEIPRDHGYPIRVIVPGHVGVRNVKWVKSITISDEESDGVWQRGIAYKSLPHYIPNQKSLGVGLEKVATIQEMPIQSCIVNVESNQVVSDDNVDDKKKFDSLSISGFAWAGGGRGVIRVDVSIDGGKTWQMADLKEGSEQKLNRAWAWTFWSADNIQIPTHLEKEVELVCKATDASYNIQPEHPSMAWNVRGLNCNSWHRVKLKL